MSAHSKSRRRPHRAQRAGSPRPRAVAGGRRRAGARRSRRSGPGRGTRRTPRAPPHARRRAAPGRLRHPRGLELFLNDAVGEPGWTAEFDHGEPDTERRFTRIDHVNLVHTWAEHDEAVLFFTSLLGLTAPAATEVAGPQGLVRSQVMRSADGAVRLPMNVAPGSDAGYPEHVALACDDIVAVAARARSRGLPFLRIPDNYYDDLRARFGLPEAELELLREHDLLHDRDARGTFRHFYTPRIGGVFFEVVERRDGYDGYGADNAPVRLAAQARHLR